MSKTLADTLRLAAEGADVAAKQTSGWSSTVAKLTSIALHFGASMAEDGKDPVIEITRVLSPKSEIEMIHDKWDDFIWHNFRQSAPPPSSPPDTEPSGPAEDIYDE